MGKEVIRAELVRPYVHTPLAPKNQAGDFAATNLPMVAMVMRNKAIALSALFIAVQSYMNEPFIKDPSDQSQPAVMKIVFAFVALLSSYIDLLFPKFFGKIPKVGGTVKDAADTVSAAISTATTATK
ncbi:DEKNAAC101952 [Brettanomyces naardenensis]|uniref:DEKNAAC101953 n=1 Tax=Brettanomyces naardenensis TaxID=13370 RepID=A0A448YJD4_BRENA|nr:DEKNAAC101952 [Brettanomyces naardenensis]